jgi:predicted glycosyltransferase
MLPNSRTLRIAMYAHDTYGLGHITRTLRLARSVIEAVPSSTVLVLTGSPVAHSLRFPRGVEYVKLPSVRKCGTGAYEARTLNVPFRSVRNLRVRILRESLRCFRPHVLFVDNVPSGMKGELLPALEYMATRKSRGSSVHLNLRDILDDPEDLRREWAKSGAYDLLDSVYDEVHVFGSPSVHDSVAAYHLPPDRTRFHGYLAPPTRGDPPRARDGRSARVLVTIGGGDDGIENVRCAMAAQRIGERPERWELDIVLGPLAGDTGARPGEVAREPGRVRVLEYVESLWRWFADYDLVLSMGGYNTLCEVMARASRSVVIPRYGPRAEQRIRARALEDRGVLRVLEPWERSPERLHEVIQATLREGPVLPSPHIPPLNGIASFKQRVRELADSMFSGRNGSGVAASRVRHGRPRVSVPSGRIGIALFLGLGLLAARPGVTQGSLLPKALIVDVAGGYDTNILDASDEEVAVFETGDPSGYFVVRRLADAFVRTSVEGRWKAPGLGSGSQLRLAFARLSYWNESIRSEHRYLALWRNRLGSETTLDLKVEHSPDVSLRHRHDKDALPGDPVFRPEVRTTWEGGLVLEQALEGEAISRVGVEVAARDFNQPFDERDRWSVRGWTGLAWNPARAVKLDLGGGYRAIRSRNEPYLGSDLSYGEWNLRSALEFALARGTRVRASVERDWRWYTSADPEDVSHYGREDTEWTFGGSLRQAIRRSLEWSAAVVHTRRIASSGMQGFGEFDEEGSYQDTVASAGLVWVWER